MQQLTFIAHPGGAVDFLKAAPGRRFFVLTASEVRRILEDRRAHAVAQSIKHTADALGLGLVAQFTALRLDLAGARAIVQRRDQAKHAASMWTREATAAHALLIALDD
jgi:hypothetical protein